MKTVMPEKAVPFLFLNPLIERKYTTYLVNLHNNFYEFYY